MPTAQLKHTKAGIATRVDENYDRDMGARVDNVKNKGSLVLIDVETGSLEIDDDRPSVIY